VVSRNIWIRNVIVLLCKSCTNGSKCAKESYNFEVQYRPIYCYSLRVSRYQYVLRRKDAASGGLYVRWSSASLYSSTECPKSLETMVNTLHMLYYLDSMCCRWPPPTSKHLLSRCTMFIWILFSIMWSTAAQASVIVSQRFLQLFPDFSDILYKSAPPHAFWKFLHYSWRDFAAHLQPRPSISLLSIDHGSVNDDNSVQFIWSCAW
jgi:hypothetical protein